MIAHIRSWLARLGETFWLLPMAMTLCGVVLAAWLVQVDRSGALSRSWLDSGWIYDGGVTGARTLLGAVASSTIGVAGTVFSITIAALSLAAGQMGPRLLRNFTRDRGVQLTLGAFVGTFAYALTVLRTVRDGDDAAFTPHLSLTVGVGLAFACVALLVYFVGHMASRINVDTVVQLVSEDLRSAIARLTDDEAPTAPPPESAWEAATAVIDRRSGYLQEIDAEGLADWAHERGVAIRLLVRPGDHVFPGAPIARVVGPTEGVAEAIRARTALGAVRVSSADLEFAIRQLVEVGVRALSAGINDPYTAISVLDRLGTALCELAPRRLRGGVRRRDGRAVLVMPAVDYAGLVDAMFHMIRQDAAGDVAVLARLLEVLASVAQCEPAADRRAVLLRHADLVAADADRTVANVHDRDDLARRHAAVRAACRC